MNQQLGKRAILKHTVKVGGLTFVSRILGIIREIFIARFFGVGALSDAFIMAFRIPNFFRHVFAEGAMSASFVPVFVKSVKTEEREASNGLMTLAFLFFEGIILLLYAFVLLKTEFIVKLIAPGFSAEQTAYTIPFLRILFPFLLLVSSYSLLGGALQAVNQFFVPAFGPVLWNMFYVGGLILALFYHLPAMVVCGGILIGGFFQFLMHLFFYFKYNFNFGAITVEAKVLFREVLKTFGPCLFGVSIVELNLFVSGIVASYLPKGSISLLYYGSRFMNIPLGIFAVALSSVLVSHFSRVVLYAPKRLNFYILETAKLVSWVVIPFILVMSFTAKPLFQMILLSKKGTPEQIIEGSIILIIYLTGLLFLCLNKILLSVFYSMKDTWSTTTAAAISAVTNLCGDIIGMYLFGTYGIAGAASLAGFVMTITCFHFLRTKHKFRFYTGNFFNFLGRYVVQLCLASIIFIACYAALMMHAPGTIFEFFTRSIGYWIFVGILSSGIMGIVYLTRNIFGLDLYFLNK